MSNRIIAIGVAFLIPLMFWWGAMTGQRQESWRIPTGCQEDQVLMGAPGSDFKGGQGWDRYVCGPALDDFKGFSYGGDN